MYSSEYEHLKILHTRCYISFCLKVCEPDKTDRNTSYERTYKYYLRLVQTDSTDSQPPIPDYCSNFSGFCEKIFRVVWVQVDRKPAERVTVELTGTLVTGSVQGLIRSPLINLGSNRPIKIVQSSNHFRKQRYNLTLAEVRIVCGPRLHQIKTMVNYAIIETWGVTDKKRTVIFCSIHNTIVADQVLF